MVIPHQDRNRFCITTVDSTISSQIYSSAASDNGYGGWTIKILLTAVYIRKRKKKKELGKEELTIGKLSIPSTIFSKKLGILESLTKYMKENLEMTYNEIAKELNRDQRTIWTAYKKAKEKQEEKIEFKETKIFLPTSVLRNRKLTTLESIVCYLKSKGLKNSEIAELLNRDQRNVWTIYSNVIKKVKEREIKRITEIKKEYMPITIFSKKIGSLEIITKYMKENLGMNYIKIVEKLNRNESTVRTAYKKSIEKQKEPIKIKETKIFVPISIFKNRKLTTLESVIIYLKEKEMRYSEIAKLLDRDQRNVWTIYSKAKSK